MINLVHSLKTYISHIKSTHHFQGLDVSSAVNNEVLGITYECFRYG